MNKVTKSLFAHPTPSITPYQGSSSPTHPPFSSSMLSFSFCMVGRTEPTNSLIRIAWCCSSFLSSSSNFFPHWTEKKVTISLPVFSFSFFSFIALFCLSVLLFLFLLYCWFSSIPFCHFHFFTLSSPSSVALFHAVSYDFSTSNPSLHLIFHAVISYPSSALSSPLLLFLLSCCSLLFLFHSILFIIYSTPFHAYFIYFTSFSPSFYQFLLIFFSTN